MQVSPSSNARLWVRTARRPCSEKSMYSNLWQLRHSCESFAFMRRHSLSASFRRFAWNFSGVSMLPSTLQQLV